MSMKTVSKWRMSSKESSRKSQLKKNPDTKILMPGTRVIQNVFSFNFDLSVKHVFVLTMAGKPVWARYGVEEQTSALMGWVKIIKMNFKSKLKICE